MTGYNDWFGVDKSGLAQLAERRDGKAWVLYELISNAWDEASTKVAVELHPEDGKPYVTIIVTDDNPEGFANLAHAWTLFARSKKRSDATVRGVFTLGEKLVLSLCTEALIKTTTGAVLFDHTGRHSRNQWKTKAGSVFEGTVRMTREELAEVRARAQHLIPPAHVATTIDGVPLPVREHVWQINATLPTIKENADGQLAPTRRMTTLRLYQPAPGETAWLYEMGVPVVETGDALHISVEQKVPLNMERDNVTPAYLREVRALVVQHAHQILSAEDKHKPWVTDAMTHDLVEPAAVNDVLDARFGPERVAADPSDREAEDIAKSRGMTVVHGGSLPGEVWSKAKAAGLIKPAGQVTPSPKPFHEDGAPLKLATEAQRDRALRGIRTYQYLARKLLGVALEVVLADDPGWAFLGAYRKTPAPRLTLNLAKLGFAHFTDGKMRGALIRLAIHEFAHHYAGNHLSEEYHEACCELGAKLAVLISDIGLSERAWDEMIGVAT